MGSSDGAIVRQLSEHPVVTDRLADILAAQTELRERATNPADVIACAPELVRRFVACEGAGLYTQSDDWFVRRAASGVAHGDTERVASAESLIGECFRRGEVQICANAATDMHVDVVLLRAAGLGAVMVVPLPSTRAVEGVLLFAANHPGAFSAADTAFVRALGGIIGAAIELGAVIQRAQTQTDEMWSALDASNQSAESHRILFEVNPTPMWIYDPLTLEILRANTAALQTENAKESSSSHLCVTDSGLS